MVLPISSACPRVDRPVSRLLLPTERLAANCFASAARCGPLTLRKQYRDSHYTKRHAVTLCSSDRLCFWFQELFPLLFRSAFLLLHSTGSLSVSREYLASPTGWSRLIRRNSSCSRYSGYSLKLRLASTIRNAIMLYGWTFPEEHSTHQFSCHNDNVVLQPLMPSRRWLGCSRSLATGESLLALHSAGAKMFQFALASTVGRLVFNRIGLSHSKSPDQGYFAYPKLIAALSRPSSPRSQGIRRTPLLTHRCHTDNVWSIYFRFNYFFLFIIMSRSFENIQSIGISKWRITVRTVDPLRMQSKVL